MGGRTEFDPELSSRQTVLAVVAGPTANVLLGLFIAAALPACGPALLSWAEIAVSVNVGWGLLNFLPILPFDGGYLLASRLGKQHTLVITLVSAGVSVAGAAVALAFFRNVSLTLLFLGAAISSIAERVQARQVLEELSLAELGMVQTFLKQGDDVRAGRVAGELARGAATSRVRNPALTALAWAALGQGKTEEAKQALDGIDPPQSVDLHCLAAIQAASGQSERAIEALEHSRAEGKLTCEAAKFLVDLYSRDDHFDRAVGVAVEAFGVLGPENCRLLGRAAFQARAFGPAATLASAVFCATCAPEDGVAVIRALAHADETARATQTLGHVVARLRQHRRFARARPLLAALRTDMGLRQSLRNAIGRAIQTAPLG
jgi:hypothetical protein